MKDDRPPAGWTMIKMDQANNYQLTIMGHHQDGPTQRTIWGLSTKDGCIERLHQKMLVY